MSDIYVKLRDKIDGIGLGYPPTEEGYEFAFLKRFFTPEDAEFFLEMIDDFETPVEFAARTGKNADVVAEKLENMSKRSLIFRLRKDGEVKYHVAPVAHGVYEFNVDKLEPGWKSEFDKHIGTSWGPQFWGTDTPLFRTVPIKAEVVAENKILAIDDAESIIRSKKQFAVAPCCCREAVNMGETKCRHDSETCMVFDDFADYYVENGIARLITLEEALRIANDGERDGRVIQVFNSTDVEIMCSCCSCCCGLMALAKYMPGPANDFISNYYCEVDEALCTQGCSDLCTGRCPIGARQLMDGELQLNSDKCIGCGLCVTVCPTEALSLVRKSEDKLYDPPQTYFDTNKAMQKYRKVVSG